MASYAFLERTHHGKSFRLVSQLGTSIAIVTVGWRTSQLLRQPFTSKHPSFAISNTLVSLLHDCVRDRYPSHSAKLVYNSSSLGDIDGPGAFSRDDAVMDLPISTSNGPAIDVSPVLQRRVLQ